MDFIYTLDLGPPGNVSDRSVKCVSKCVQRTPCIKKFKFSGPTCVTPWITSLALGPRNLHSDPSPGDSDPQQSYRSTCNGVGCVWGEELPWGAGSIRRREGGPRLEEGGDHDLTPFLLLSCFSSQPGLTPPPGAGCREKLPEWGRVSSYRPWSSRGVPWRRKELSQGK